MSNSTAPLSVKVILGSTREGRFGDKPAHWILGEAARREGVEAQLVDLRDFPLPFFDRPTAPSREGGRYENAAVARWAETIASADGYIVVTPEYNHGFGEDVVEGVLKHHPERDPPALRRVPRRDEGACAAKPCGVRAP